MNLLKTNDICTNFTYQNNQVCSLKFESREKLLNGFTNQCLYLTDLEKNESTLIFRSSLGASVYSICLREENVFFIGDNKGFVKGIDNFYLYSKKENKYISKGEGFISIETTEKDGKKFAFVMFRNTFGNLIVQGILNKDFNKFDSYLKNFKHVAHFYFLMENEEESNGKEEKKKVIVTGNAKVPFMNEKDCTDFGEKYKQAINFLKGIETKEEKKEEDKKNGKSDDKKEEKKTK